MISYLCKDSKKDILLKYRHDWERRFLHIVKKNGMSRTGIPFYWDGNNLETNVVHKKICLKNFLLAYYL